MIETIQRWGGVLVRPRATFEAVAATPPPPRAERGWRSWIRPSTGWDGVWLTLLFVLGSQVERVTEALARFLATDSVLILLNGLLMAVLAPLLVGLLVEGLVGAQRARYRHLPLVPLVLAATVGNIIRQQGFVWPGPALLPEIVGTLWAASLAVYVRQTIPPDPKRRTQAPKGAEA